MHPLDHAPDEKGLNPPTSRFDFREFGHVLLDLAFFVDHMLAHYWIVLFDFHLIWCVFLIFIGCVVMACTSARNQLNFISHDLFLFVEPGA
jgi:hypothetical protein